MAALSSGPLLTTASKDLASQIFHLFASRSQSSGLPLLGCTLQHVGWYAPRRAKHPGCARQPGSACRTLPGARSSCSGGHEHSGTANMWLLDSQDKETGPEILCSAVRVCTAPLEYSPALGKFAEAPLLMFLRLK